LETDTLDAQVAELQRQKELAKEADKLERLRNQEIQRVLEAAERDQALMQHNHMQDLKRDWEGDIARKESERVNPLDYDVSNCGLASAQNFTGEDPAKEDRIKDQQDQMRRWIQEQLAEKAQKALDDKDEDRKFADMMNLINDIRLAAEKEEEELRKAQQKDVNAENDMLSKMRERPEEDPGALSLDINEDLNEMRKDAFRGLTDAQRRRILQENEALLAKKREQQELDRMTDHDWAVQQALINKALEQAKHDENMMRADENAKYLDFLKGQADEQARARDTDRRNRFGEIEPNYFRKYGTSCR
jgi:hypothetical protein